MDSYSATMATVTAHGTSPSLRAIDMVGTRRSALVGRLGISLALVGRLPPPPPPESRLLPPPLPPPPRPPPETARSSPLPSPLSSPAADS